MQLSPQLLASTFLEELWSHVETSLQGSPERATFLSTVFIIQESVVEQGWSECQVNQVAVAT